MRETPMDRFDTRPRSTQDRTHAVLMLALLVSAVGINGCGGNKTIVVPAMPAAPAAATT
ncbi:MAG: hypothetical protein HUU37_09380, partial [Bdellovibrionales bacterium]|nr:hypothetical protein [Bdellovibrionales bacterium]